VTSVAAATVRYGTATTRFSEALHGNGQAGSDMVLVGRQAAASENGLYWANTGGAMVRCTEPLVPSRVVHVAEGSQNARTRYELTTQGPLVVGTTDLSFSPQNVHYNVRDFGAIPDWNGTSGTDNLAAFQAALAAARVDQTPNKASRLYVNGAYYLSGTLHIEQTIAIEGTAHGDETFGSAYERTRSDAGAMLVFPANTTGIRVHTTAADEVGAGIAAFLTKSGSTITLTGGTGFTPEMLGRSIRISNANTAGNNGTFAISAFYSDESVSWTNAAGATDNGVASLPTRSKTRSPRPTSAAIASSSLSRTLAPARAKSA
jgi:hypothetical protein